MNPLSMHPDDLASLKDDMVAFIAGHGIRRVPAQAGEDIPSLLWEDEANPDSWKDFVETAKAAGAAFITMSEDVLEKEDVELLIEEVQDQDFDIEMVTGSSELDEAQSLVRHIGKVGHLQLGFPHQGFMFLYETSTRGTTAIKASSIRWKVSAISSSKMKTKTTSREQSRIGRCRSGRFALANAPAAALDSARAACR